MPVLERMVWRSPRGRVPALLLWALTGACSASPAAAGQGDGGTSDEAGDDGAPTYAPTYHAVYNEVLAPNCALVFCHGGTGDYLQLDTEADGYPSLVGARAEGPMCSLTGLDRVDPGHPDRSLVFLKITNPPCGSRMPLDSFEPLPVRQIDQIAQWIACGALDGTKPCPADAGAFEFDGAFFAGDPDAATE